MTMRRSRLSSSPEPPGAVEHSGADLCGLSPTFSDSIRGSRCVDRQDPLLTRVSAFRSSIVLLTLLLTIS